VLLRMRAGAGAAGIELDAGSAETAARCVEAAEALRRVQAAGTLLSVEFETLQDYLHYLRACVCALAPLRRRALLYSAAAVSDFFSAPSRQAVHKIQSGDGPLELVLEQTPKLLASIRAGWAPEACVVSFKLETDPSILFDKAAAALARYGVDAVVANELQSRARRVWLVERSGARREIATAPDGTELEAELVAACADLHTRHINAAAK
jgi:phosphopantothenate-cysteine ligase